MKYTGAVTWSPPLFFKDMKDIEDSVLKLLQTFLKESLTKNFRGRP